MWLIGRNPRSARAALCVPPPSSGASGVSRTGTMRLPMPRRDCRQESCPHSALPRAVHGNGNTSPTYATSRTDIRSAAVDRVAEHAGWPSQRAATVATTGESMCWNVWPTKRAGRGSVGDLKLEPAFHEMRVMCRNPSGSPFGGKSHAGGSLSLAGRTEWGGFCTDGTEIETMTRGFRTNQRRKNRQVVDTVKPPKVSRAFVGFGTFGAAGPAKSILTGEIISPRTRKPAKDHDLKHLRGEGC